ncbi:hypothetical protein GCM10008933_14940 [Paenibacillus motobuensis]|uniref:Uncharacterized protein n=1 Tax=Paenibacillus motobuensis TaxID=295324 RepID=A0ABP3HYL8_9BACL
MALPLSLEGLLPNFTSSKCFVQTKERTRHSRKTVLYDVGKGGRDPVRELDVSG